MDLRHQVHDRGKSLATGLPGCLHGLFTRHRHGTGDVFRHALRRTGIRVARIPIARPAGHFAILQRHPRHPVGERHNPVVQAGGDHAGRIPDECRDGVHVDIRTELRRDPCRSQSGGELLAGCRGIMVGGGGGERDPDPGKPSGRRGDLCGQQVEAGGKESLVGVEEKGTAWFRRNRCRQGGAATSSETRGQHAGVPRRPGVRHAAGMQPAQCGGVAHGEPPGVLEHVPQPGHRLRGLAGDGRSAKPEEVPVVPAVGLPADGLDGRREVGELAIVEAAGPARFRQPVGQAVGQHRRCIHAQGHAHGTGNGLPADMHDRDVRREEGGEVGKRVHPLPPQRPQVRRQDAGVERLEAMLGEAAGHDPAQQQVAEVVALEGTDQNDWAGKRVWHQSGGAE